MITAQHLRTLAQRHGADRAYLSLYLRDEAGRSWLKNRFSRVRALLTAEEQEHFDENQRIVQEKLDAHSFGENGVCIFACWADDFVEVHSVEHLNTNLLWFDSSPYIRPLAELLDEYETFAVVKADNTRAEVFVVTAERDLSEADSSVRGDVKNRVKKGGWSQKRYARRREKELHRYATSVADALKEAADQTPFARIVLVGQQEALAEIRDALPTDLADKVVGQEAVDVDNEEQVWDEAYALFTEEEHADERALWETIRDAYMRGGAAAVGPEDVLREAAVGRVHKLLVARDARIAGVRCRSCENIHAHQPETCPACGSNDLFTVDLINELVELASLSSATTEFADTFDALDEAGQVAALLRWA